MTYSDSCEDKTASGATHGELKLNSNFDCSVSFSDNQITISQYLQFSIYLKWDWTGETVDFFDKIYKDIYFLSIDQNGNLQISEPHTVLVEYSKKSKKSKATNFFTHINDVINRFDPQVGKFLNAQIDDIPASSIQNFVFPGAKAFTYKEVGFSKNQDLVTKITYLIDD